MNRGKTSPKRIGKIKPPRKTPGMQAPVHNKTTRRKQREKNTPEVTKKERATKGQKRDKKQRLLLGVPLHNEALPTRSSSIELQDLKYSITGITTELAKVSNQANLSVVSFSSAKVLQCYLKYSRLDCET